MNPHQTPRINIAIDGPAGAGKSTVARMAARDLQYIYVDTGAMYRTVALKAMESGLTADDAVRVTELAERLDIRLIPGPEGQKVIADGEDVSSRIRSLEVNRQVSHFAKIEGVRNRMATLQRRMAKEKGVVMDGRDIGTHVLPDAELKVFLTASPRERALRRFKELGDNPGVTLEQLELDIADRDRIDQEREIAPLIRAKDAKLVDSTGRTAEEVASEIVEWGLAIARTISAEEK
ncbi:(d)CMP kinase [Cohnella sp. CFH 77786]|uniref:(d)CMP kinase n=1 Tax=Cohnella sp. CFH 77786 TaxID=2662265 RepID=UPI001C609248|nr:(d)CMP kinase [Cohnella sp. CFH 77786]MBW5446665.1 (d)CMP kinase [Cohnella sp. CFH 77786]